MRHPRIGWSVIAEDCFLIYQSAVRFRGLECRSVCGMRAKSIKHGLCLQTFLPKGTFSFFPGRPQTGTWSKSSWRVPCVFLACGHFHRISTTVLPLGTSPDLDLWPKSCAFLSLCWSWWSTWDNCKKLLSKCLLPPCGFKSHSPLGCSCVMVWGQASFSLSQAADS